MCLEIECLQIVHLCRPDIVLHTVLGLRCLRKAEVVLTMFAVFLGKFASFAACGGDLTEVKSESLYP
jgi:hypothetical protein